MPIEAKITRDGEDLPLRWGWWHIECMTDAVRAMIGDEGKEIALLTVWSRGDTCNGVTLDRAISFKDPSDGEVLTLLPMDRLLIYRTS